MVTQVGRDQAIGISASQNSPIRWDALNRGEHPSDANLTSDGTIRSFEGGHILRVSTVTAARRAKVICWVLIIIVVAGSYGDKAIKSFWPSVMTVQNEEHGSSTKVSKSSPKASVVRAHAGDIGDKDLKD